jgi:hypothetical protein
MWGQRTSGYRRFALTLITQVRMLAAARGFECGYVRRCNEPGSTPLLTFLLGVGSAMSGPAWQAMITDLVAPQEVPDCFVIEVPAGLLLGDRPYASGRYTALA